MADVIVDGALHLGEAKLVIIHLTEADKENIASMAPDAALYASFPEGLDRAGGVEAALNFWKPKVEMAARLRERAQRILEGEDWGDVQEFARWVLEVIGE